MKKILLHALKAKHWRRHHRQQGFTLVELLIVTLIAGGIVSGLMFLVVELLTADQRDASRNATQQDMQRSLDYISTELRDAVYVYSGACLYGTDECTREDGQGILDYLPETLRSDTSSPVIAFWKQAPLPSNVLEYCSNISTPQEIEESDNSGIPCIAGHSYSLVVYSLDTARPANSPWSGKARITRYELRRYENAPGRPTPMAGYVTPILGPRNLFASWPLDLDDDSQQSVRPTTNRAPIAPLTDFVDVATPGTTPSCPVQADGTSSYSISPPAADASDSFYACINTSRTPAAAAIPATPNRTQSESIENQEVILYLRGNGFGRPSISEAGNNAYKPTLTTRVFNRGTLDINPATQRD